jgi:hypothetical protein
MIRTYVFGSPESVSLRYGTGSFYHQAKIVRKTPTSPTPSPSSQLIRTSSFTLTFALLEIRIQMIHKFLALLDPAVSQRFRSGFFYHEAKIVRKTLIPNVL